MKITVTVDLSEFYTEEDEHISFSQAIKEYIAYDVKNKVLADFKQRAGDEFNIYVKQLIDQQKDGFITGVVSELITTAKVKKPYSGGEPISISEWVAQELERTVLSDSKVKEIVTKNVKQATDNIGDELKRRYDLLFASQIVAKLHENGMLKEDVAKLLLTEKLPS